MLGPHGGLPEVEWRVCITFVYKACTPLHTHTLKTGTTSVWELSRREHSLGLVPGQVSTVTTRPGATWRGPGTGSQCRPRHALTHLHSPTRPRAHLHMLTAQAQLVGLLLKEGPCSPWRHKSPGAEATYPRFPPPRQSWGCVERGADTRNELQLPQHNSTSLVSVPKEEDVLGQ